MTSNYEVSTNLAIFSFYIFDNYKVNFGWISAIFLVLIWFNTIFFIFQATRMFLTTTFELMALKHITKTFY